MLNVDDRAEDVPMEGEEILTALSKWRFRRSKHRNLQSLKFLSFQATAANAERNSHGDPDAPRLPLRKLCMKNVTNTFENLNNSQLCIFAAPTLKSKFVEHLLLNSQRITAENAKQLLHKESTKFDMGVVEKGEQQWETWRFMVENCPLMETIIWRDLNGVPFVNFPIGDLLKMPKVVHIEMPDFWCNDKTFVIFAQNFKNLRFVNTR
jgi:hypothetical protein